MTDDRLLLKIDRLERMERQLAELRREVIAGCRAYSDQQRITVLLTPIQVKRDIARRREAEAGKRAA